MKRLKLVPVSGCVYRGVCRWWASDTQREDTLAHSKAPSGARFQRSVSIIAPTERIAILAHNAAAMVINREIAKAKKKGKK